MNRIPCRICQRRTAVFLFRKNGFELWNCGSCGAAFVKDIPSAEEIQKHYGLDYFQGNLSKFGYVDYVAEESLQRDSFAEKIDFIRKRRATGRILDVGCATGGFLKQMGPGWEKHGVEISQELLKTHPPSPDISVWSGDFSNYPQNGRGFDVVTLWDVLDHVPDPIATLQKVRQLLNPGGLLALNVGDRSSLFARLLGKRWHLYIPPTHLTFFSRKALLELLERCGFRLLGSEYHGKWVSLSLCFFRMSYIGGRSFFRKLYEWSTHSRVGKTKVYINLEDVITVYAVKS